MVDQSYSERQLFEKAYERILSEFQLVMNVPLEDAKKKLDKTLKRNFEGQVKANNDSTEKLIAPEALVAEQITETSK